MGTTKIWSLRYASRPTSFVFVLMALPLCFQGCNPECDNCLPPAGPAPSISFSLVKGGKIETQTENDAFITVFRNDQLQLSYQIDIPNGFLDATVNGQLVNMQNVSLGTDGRTADLKYSPWQGGIRSGMPDTMVVRDQRLYSSYFAIHPVYEIGLNPEDIVSGTWQEAHFGIPEDVTIERLIGTADEGILAVAGGTIYKGTNNGNTWKKVFDDDGGLITGVVLHPSGDLYAVGITGLDYSYSVLYKSKDNGSTWALLKTDLPSESLYYGHMAMGISKEGTLQLYVYAASKRLSGIWRSQDGENWSLSSDLLSNSPFNSYWAISLSVVNDSTTFALLGGYDNSILIHSFDYGKTWITTSLPGQSFENLLYSSHGEIYISSNGSVLVSEDLGETWKKKEFGIPGYDVPINAIAEGPDGKIYIAPQNYGVFTLDEDRWKSVGTNLAPYNVLNCFRVGGTVYAGVQPSTLYKLD